MHYAQKTETESGAPIYGAVKPWRGATEISLPPVGEDKKVYADNTVWFVIPVNQGYEGEVSFYQIPDDFRTNHLGEYKDENGVYIERSGTPQYGFALLGQFEIAGDEAEDNTGKRFALFNCSAGRTDLSGQTKEDTVDPSAFSIPIIVSPTASDGVVKASLKKSDNEELYNSWFSSVYYNPEGLIMRTVNIKVNQGSNPVYGAVVVVGDKIAITNESGIAKIAQKAGEYNLIVSKDGLTPVTDKVVVSSSSVTKTINLVV